MKKRHFSCHNCDFRSAKKQALMTMVAVVLQIKKDTQPNIVEDGPLYDDEVVLPGPPDDHFLTFQTRLQQRFHEDTIPFKPGSFQTKKVKIG